MAKTGVQIQGFMEQKSMSSITNNNSNCVMKRAELSNSRLSFICDFYGQKYGQINVCSQYADTDYL